MASKFYKGNTLDPLGTYVGDHEALVDGDPNDPYACSIYVVPVNGGFVARSFTACNAGALFDDEGDVCGTEHEAIESLIEKIGTYHGDSAD